MMEWLVTFRKRLINGWNRALYLGEYKDFPRWCEGRAVQFDRAFYEAELMQRPIARIELCRVKVGNLRTSLFGQKYRMKDSLVFRSLVGEVPYSDYVTRLNATGDLSHEGLQNDYPSTVLAWIKQGGAKQWPIVINPKDMILDGQHRACCYLFEKGENAIVDAVRVYTLPVGGSLLQKALAALRGRGRMAK